MTVSVFLRMQMEIPDPRGCGRLPSRVKMGRAIEDGTCHLSPSVYRSIAFGPCKRTAQTEKSENAALAKSA